jgi:glycosyltransferase involved in cell wall biosynthesis
VQPRRPIIALAPNDWLTAWAGRQQLLSKLAARGWPVLYSIGTMSLWDRGGARWQRAGLATDFVLTDGVWLDTPGRLQAHWPRSAGWTQRAMAAHARRLAAFARSLGPEPPLLFLFHPRFLDYADLIPHAALAYHAFDDFSGLPGWTDAQATQEARLAARADVVFAVSREVGERLPAPGPSRYIELQNGADADAFAAGSAQPCPPDLAAVPGPRIGYVGRISLKLDVELLRSLAEARPAFQWVYIGPVSFPREGSDRAAFDALTRLPNVHFLGEKSHRELPAYQAHMNVNILCYKTSPGWWVSCYPLKIHEYLASGPPVVATALASLREFGAVLAMPDAETSGWLAAVDAAVAGHGIGTRATRLATAAANSWDHRVDLLESHLARLPRAA